jgi:hypothetical protein
MKFEKAKGKAKEIEDRRSGKKKAIDDRRSDTKPHTSIIIKNPTSR